MTQPPQTFNEALDVIFTELKSLMISKQTDYGPGNILAFGELGVLVRMSDKMERLKNLHKTGRMSDPLNESVDDNLKDSANYPIIALMLRRGWFTLPVENTK